MQSTKVSATCRAQFAPPPSPPESCQITLLCTWYYVSQDVRAKIYKFNWEREKTV